ncbi:MAG: DNA/RNA helicase domain-containing protein [Pseudomonadota bacterium]
MIIYQTEKSGFLHDLHTRDIEEVIGESFRAKTGRRVGQAEIKAWANSLEYMGKVLMDEAIPADCGVAIEYNIPQTSKRVDFLITGRNAEQKDCLIIVELKQWETAEKTDKDAVVVTRLGGGKVETSHPSYQAWSYAALLKNFNEAVEDSDIRLQPCAYLHNYGDHDGAILDPFYAPHIERAPLFLKGGDERRKLQDFIKKHVRHGDKAQTLYKIEGGRIRPSRSLADGLVSMLAQRPYFVMIDDQKLVYETAMKQARAVRDGGKKVLIVEGGPGTGKSVVAVNLLVGLTQAGLVSQYVTKNAAPRAVYEAALTGSYSKSHISNLFVGSGKFTESGENEYDALVVDEAHRLNEKSGLYANLGEHQVKEIIRAARFCVFFVDESQKVTLRDVGDKDTIRKYAKEMGATVTVMELASQFRCNGSDGYLAWLDHTLQIRETANTTLDTKEFDFRVVDSPSELRELILEKNKERNRARMVAGYCWGWPSKKDPKAYDIVIPEHDFRARWNLTQDGGLWMVSPNSVNEVGCIHTCQGLEVDYIGVIVGPDLIVRDGQVVTQPEKRAASDQSVKGWKQLAKTNPEEARKLTDAIIKNTYRTLMTRGMKGCYVYTPDKDLRDSFELI